MDTQINEYPSLANGQFQNDLNLLHTFAILSAVSLQNWVGLSKCWIKWGNKHKMLRGNPAKKDIKQNLSVHKHIAHVFC